MSTETQINANRQNAALSTGPKTEAGKAISSQNRFQHGLASGQLIIAGEDPADYDALLHSLTDENQPANINEELLVIQIAQQFWLGQRAIRLQSAYLADYGFQKIDRFSVLLRYQAQADRAGHRALAALQALQKQRRKDEIGFVSQPSQPAAKLSDQPTAPTPHLQPSPLDSPSCFVPVPSILT